ncbi:hypothetical protein BS50DRAFT_387467 [Corynespora cassiicola Philippines]|uniref:Uncharacterized protein n=1 Tax=Corynespora cassiicola Philippines TaxID=1448308 RepID=A0A2T2NPF0_CORCC|nr:hypothetical protein BS50DRAFT_387467 [Corynespora cassiicola Philippines]
MVKMDTAQQRRYESHYPRSGSETSSNHPEYAFSPLTRFTRDEDGRRLSPLSQLNTRTGRQLAATEESCNSSVCPTEFSAADRPTDRDLLPSQKSRFNPSHLLDQAFPQGDGPLGTSMDDGSPTLIESMSSAASSEDAQSTSSLGDARSAAPSPPLEQACIECGQIPSKSYSGSRVSHVCPACKLFVPVISATAIQSSPLPSESESSDTDDDALVPTRPLKCMTCRAIPKLIYAEWRQFFPVCSDCGCMLEQTFFELVKKKGEVHGLKDDDGRLFLSPSKDLDGFCVRTSQQGDFSIPTTFEISFPRTTGSIRSTALGRRNAVKKSASTKSNPVRPTKAPAQGDSRGPKRARAFSFDIIPRSELDIDPAL